MFSEDKLRVIGRGLCLVRVRRVVAPTLLEVRMSGCERRFGGVNDDSGRGSGTHVMTVEDFIGGYAVMVESTVVPLIRVG
jgi:hypothetical protein